MVTADIEKDSLKALVQQVIEKRSDASVRYAFRTLVYELVENSSGGYTGIELDVVIQHVTGEYRRGNE